MTVLPVFGVAVQHSPLDWSGGVFWQERAVEVDAAVGSDAHGWRLEDFAVVRRRGDRGERLEFG